MKIHLIRSKTFRRWMICYAIVMLIPICFNGILYINTRRVLTDHAYENGRMAVNQTGSVLDDQLQTVCRLGDDICSSNDIRYLQYIDAPFDAEKYYDIHKHAKYLGNFGAYNKVVPSIFVYSRPLDCLIDSLHIYTDNNQLDDLVEKEFSLSREQFDSLMSERHRYNLYLSGSKLIFLHTIAGSYREGEPPLTLVMTLRADSFTEVLSDMEVPIDGDSFILLESDKFLRGGQAEGTDNSFFDVYSENGTGSFYERYPVDDYVIATADSRLLPIHYAVAVSRKSLMEDVRNSRMLFTYLIAVTVILGLIICYLLARSNYQPLQELKDLAQVKASDESDFSLIAGHLRELQTQQEQMQTELQRLNALEDRQFLRNLLHGRTAKNQLQSSGEGKGGLDPDAVFLVIVVNLQGEITLEKENLEDKLRDEYIRYSENACRCMTVRENNDYAVLLGFARGAEPYDAQLFATDISKKILDLDIESEAGKPVGWAYVGSAHEGLEGISISYSEAMKTRDYVSFISENPSTVTAYDQTMYSTEVSWEPYDIVTAEQQFVSSVVEGRYSEGQKILKQIIAYYTSYEGVSLYVLRFRMYSVMNMMFSVFRDITPDMGIAAGEREVLMKKIMTTRTMQELVDVLNEMMTKLTSNRSHQLSELEEKLLQAKNYIHQNYHDQNLSVQQVADSLNISLPYLSREFKLYTGNGVLAYINEYRIRKAKEIMEADSSASLVDIAQRIGFTSSQTFIRVFKRYEGMTPGKYRGKKKEAVAT